MKPYRITLFVFSVILLLGIISLLFPADGLRVGSFTIHFPTLEEMLSPKGIEYADISELQLAADTITVPEVVTVKDTSEEGFQIRLIEIDELKTRHLEFPDGDPSILYPFFQKLDSLAHRKRQIRVLHYGDSQIEGDRITNVLRRRFQSQFGGSGPGMVPVVELYNSRAVKRTLDGPWERHTLFGPGRKTAHTQYGALASYSRFKPVFNDTLPDDSSIIKASVTFSPANFPYNKCRIFAGNAFSPVTVDIFQNDKLIKSDTVKYKLHVITCDLKRDSAVTISFTGTDSPDIYGIDLSSGPGIMFDNIPMRGSSGTIFTRINSMQLKQMYELMNVELIILQYGGNVMPYIESEQACKNYGNWFYSQIKHIQRARPNASIIVIGPSDMSMKDKEHYITYPFLENVRDELKKASHRAGAAYWDIYEAMGGKNSMPSWVAADPPLASPDYVHFSYRGARLIGDMFYNALIWEYQQYRKKNKHLYQ